MGVVVAVTRPGVSRCVATLVDVISLVVAIVAVTPSDSYGCQHHKNGGGGLVNIHWRVP